LDVGIIHEGISTFKRGKDEESYVFQAVALSQREGGFEEARVSAYEINGEAGNSGVTEVALKNQIAWCRNMDASSRYCRNNGSNCK
jgi:hypothetical protein